MSREKKDCETAFAFVKFHAGKTCFAPCTGQDYRALAAFAHLMALWCASDTLGRSAAEKGMTACLQAMQVKVWYLAKWMIPAIGDWSYTDEIWRRIAGWADDPIMRDAGTERGRRWE